MSRTSRAIRRTPSPNLIVGPGDGTVELTDATTGTLTYTPPSASFFGLVQVTYTVTDGAKNTATGNVIINVEQTIQPEDDGPIVAVAGKPLTISAVDLLGNDIAAPNGLKLSIGSVGNATNGTVVLNSDGSVTFTPTAEGAASFTYTDTDADSDASTVATVTLNVKLGPTIHWADPADIVYGTPLSQRAARRHRQCARHFLVTAQPRARSSMRDDQKLVVTFTPTDTADYAGSTATVHINVVQATAVRRLDRAREHCSWHATERHPARRDGQRARIFSLHSCRGHDSSRGQRPEL